MVRAADRALALDVGRVVAGRGGEDEVGAVGERAPFGADVDRSREQEVLGVGGRTGSGKVPHGGLHGCWVALFRHDLTTRYTMYQSASIIHPTIILSNSKST